MMASLILEHLRAWECYFAVVTIKTSSRGPAAAGFECHAQIALSTALGYRFTSTKWKL